MVKYTLEFILHAKNCTPKAIRSSLAEFGQDLVVNPVTGENQNSNYQVSMVTEDPTLVFDLCAQLGRIRSVKVHEKP